MTPFDATGPVTYLDHAASTPVRPEALEAMLPWLGGRCGNPSGAHRMAREARAALDDARDVVADAVGAAPGDVIWTSGGTEADHLAVAGVDGGAAVAVCSAVEHHAVLDAVRDGRWGAGATVGVDAAGRVSAASVADAIARAGGDVDLVSVMTANNETGVVQPLAEVVDVVRRTAPGAVVHTDAVQAAAWLDLPAVTAGADLVSLSAHKFGGPKGVGALVVRGAVPVRAVLVGGGQERGRRSGTPNVAGAVAMGVALAAARAEREAAVARVAALGERLRSGLLATIPGAVDTVPPVEGRLVERLPNIVHLCLPDVETEALIVALEADGVMVSAAASCASGALEPSHVLAAMGVAPALAGGSVRLSLGWCSQPADVDRALAVIPDAVARLRQPRRR